MSRNPNYWEKSLPIRLWIKNNLKTVLNIVLSLASILLIFIYFRWVGYKGVISFLLGMVIMAYLLLSNNIIMRSLIKIFEAKQTLKELMKK